MKKGISLVALIITIICLIILTGAVLMDYEEEQEQYNNLNKISNTTCPLCNGTGKYEK